MLLSQMPEQQSPSARHSHIGPAHKQTPAVLQRPEQHAPSAKTLVSHAAPTSRQVHRESTQEPEQQPASVRHQKSLGLQWHTPDLPQTPEQHEGSPPPGLSQAAPPSRQEH